MWSFITNQYDYYITSQEDPRVRDHPLMDSPKIPIILSVGYLIIVKYIGPALMKNRPAFELKKSVMFYNAFQMLFSLYIFCKGFCFIFTTKEINFWCTPHVHRMEPNWLEAVDLAWLFLIGRYFEFIDTFIFILRKKNNQVTTLHVVHHSIVPLICWVGNKIVPASIYNFAGVLNSFVHTIMYFYYLVSAMGPDYKKYIWWKQYLTVIQLIQFLLTIVHTGWTLASGCKIPQVFGYLVLAQAVLFFYLFLDFYNKSFEIKKGKENKKDSSFKFTFNISKYTEKYKCFLEMCVPNQNVLFNEEETNTEEYQKEDINNLNTENLNKVHLDNNIAN